MSPLTKQASVVDQLLGDILTGTYPAGSRLPAERELAERLHASRGTLREGLRKLEALGVVEARRGSGIEVLDFRKNGRVGLIPAFLKAGAPGTNPLLVLADLLYLRRVLAREVVVMAARRAEADAIERVRVAVGEAWQLRADPLAFATADFEAFGELARATGFLPLVWMFNTYRETVRELVSLAGPPPADPDYARTMYATLDAITAGEGEQAQEILDTYYARLDRVLLGGSQD